MEISNLSSGLMEGLPAFRVLPRDQEPGLCVLLYRRPPPWWRVVLDMTSLRWWHLANATGTWRPAPAASGLWIIMVAAISGIPLSFFCSRHAIQLRSVHIRIFAARHVGLLFT